MLLYLPAVVYPGYLAANSSTVSKAGSDVSFPFNVPSAQSTAYASFHVAAASCCTALACAFSIIPPKVGIKTAAKIAITAITITNSTKVKPFIYILL